ncbi:MAG: sugar phosphate nucleotidyltransferase [bacterium]|nr:sugar phosphate nucleotidyltransferase [bacterium]
MKVIVFSGGVGTRFWPASRKKFPKQFHAVVGKRSLLQSRVDSLVTQFKVEDIFISTNSDYVDEVKDQLPGIPFENIIAEPMMKDTAAAVGYAVVKMQDRFGEQEPLAILWSDHIVKKPEIFLESLKIADKLVLEQNKFVLLAVPPRYPSSEKGYIKTTNRIKQYSPHIGIYKFEKFVEKPDIETAKEYIIDGNYYWNPGYLVATPELIMQKYKEFAPEIHNGLIKIADNINSDKLEEIEMKVFESLEKVAIDYVVSENLESDDALVVVSKMDWSDVGDWFGLKEALEEDASDVITKGNVLDKNSEDCLIYNYSDKALVTTLNLNNMIVVVTDDAVLVCNKDDMGEVKKMVKGFDNTKYAEFQ